MINTVECLDGYCSVPSQQAFEGRSEALARQELRRQRAAHQLGAPILQRIELINPAQQQQPQHDMERTA